MAGQSSRAPRPGRPAPPRRAWGRRVGTDVVLARAFLRNGGISRAVLVACCTALVSGLLFVALTVCLYTVATSATFGGTDRNGEILGGLVNDANVRVGYLTGVLLITLAPLTLLRQVLRLGTAAREQRLAGLRLAGATPADVRRLARLEVGVPAFVGALAGYLVFLCLRAAFGGLPREEAMFGPHGTVPYELRLIPTTVSPAWWHVALVALAVGLVGAFAGAAATGRVAVTPLGVSRRQPRRPPRPWAALVLFVLGLTALGYTATGGRSGSSTFMGIATVLLVVTGLLLLTPWLAYTAGRVVVGRATTAHVLLAGRRLVTDPRPAGRAAAAIGVIGLVAGFGSVIVTDLPSSSGTGKGFRGVDPFYTVPSVLVALVLVLSLSLIVFSLAVHGAETLMDRKRAIASLAAAGAAEGDLVRAQRWEVGLVAVPVTVAGLVLGTVPALIALSADGIVDGAYAWIPVTANLATAGCALLAVLLATRLTRPWLRRASSAANLRTT
ncbi:MAG TPA: FtsX-like permease family protein [Nocardioides sp.]|nr:FtsX-like permease family protein [Nocardioides sp.]